MPKAKYGKKSKKTKPRPSKARKTWGGKYPKK